MLIQFLLGHRLLGCILVALLSISASTVLVLCSMDPKTPIVREMESRHGSLAWVSVEAMQTWFTQHPDFAVQVASECGASTLRKNYIRWADTTEGHICKAAAPVAAYASLTTNWSHN